MSRKAKARKKKSGRRKDFSFNIYIKSACTLSGRMWGSRLRLRHVVVPLVSRRRRRLCHGFLLVCRCRRCIFPRWHSFVYGIQTLGLSERGNFVIRREALKCCMNGRKKEDKANRMLEHAKL